MSLITTYAIDIHQKMKVKNKMIKEVIKETVKLMSIPEIDVKGKKVKIIPLYILCIEDKKCSNQLLKMHYHVLMLGKQYIAQV